MATNQYLVITDGTTTVTIADGSGGTTNYRLLRGTWSPNVAGLRRSQLGGNGPYDDVVEEMQLIINGATAEAALTNVQTLYTLLDQADRWYRGEAVSTVLIKYSPRGATTSSAAAPLQAAILGRADGDATALRLPDIFEDVGLFQYVANVTIRFRRRGLWLLGTETGTHDNVINGDLSTCTLTGAAENTTRLSPTYVSVSQVNYASTCIPPYIIISNRATSIQIINADGMTATGFTTFDDSAKSARNTTILRYTPTGTTAALSGTGSISSISGTIAIYINYRNNSSTTTFSVRAKVNDGVTFGSKYGKTKDFPGETSPYPKWDLLDIMSASVSFSSIMLEITASAASGTFDIDSIVIARISEPSTNVIRVYGSASSGSYLLEINHGALTRRSPIITLAGEPVPYAGDSFFNTNYAGTVSQVFGVCLATGGTALDFWRYTSGTAAYNDWTITRNCGFLVPR